MLYKLPFKLIKNYSLNLFQIILITFFFSINVKAATTATTINVNPDDAINTSDYGTNTTFSKVSDISVSGCKTQAGSPSNSGGLYLVGGVASPTNNLLVVCKNSPTSGLPEVINLNDPYFKNITSDKCISEGSGSICPAYKVNAPQTKWDEWYKDPSKPTQNYLKQFQDRRCDLSANANLPFCTNILTQISASTATKFEVQVQSTPPPPTATDVAITVSVNTDQTCSYLSDKILVAAESWLKKDNKYNCKCVTLSTEDPSKILDLYKYGYQGVYFIDDQGNKAVSYTEDNMRSSLFSANNASWNIAANNCLKSNSLVYNTSVGGCYESVQSCKDANCSTGDIGKYKYKGQFYETIQLAQRKINSDAEVGCRGAGQYTNCIESNFKILMKQLKKCDCSESYNVNYDPIGCTLNNPLSNCDSMCKLIPVNAQSLSPVSPRSPLAIINVIVNLLFWFAVMLLILNFITAGIEMVQSGNEPQKMKEATERIQSTIFGFIFVLVVSGVINYLINLLNIIIK